MYCNLLYARDGFLNYTIYTPNRLFVSSTGNKQFAINKNNSHRYCLCTPKLNNRTSLFIKRRLRKNLLPTSILFI